MQNDFGIYLDNHASTAVDPDIVAGLREILSRHVGNASSTDHAHGQWAKSIVDDARTSIAETVHAHEAGVIFTSGATESSNLVIRSIAAEKPGCVLVVSAVEHPSVLETARYVTNQTGGELRIVDVDGKGRIDLDELVSKAVGATLGCFMAANHEMGAIYPITRIGAILKSAGARFLCDATQALGKIPIDLVKSHIDFLVFSGHKIHALQGIGGLACAKPKPKLQAIMTGGSQQGGYRPGTFNLPGIWSLGKALAIAAQHRSVDHARMAALRDRLWRSLQDRCEGLVLTGDSTDRLPNNLHFCMTAIENTMVIERLRGKVSVSTGAACSSGAVEPSRVLKAMRMPRERINGAIRIGLSRFTTAAEVEEASAQLAGAINDVRSLARIQAV